MHVSQNAVVRPIFGDRRAVDHRQRARLRYTAANDRAARPDYGEQCETGRRSAEALVARMASEDSPHLLGFAVLEMMSDRRPWSGEHVGFFHAIAERLV